MRLKPISIILVLFVLLALCYAYATPIFESPDELTHVGFMDYVATTGQIPVQVVGVQTRWEQEGSQPPLYYLITGWLTRWTDRGDYDAVTQHNPHAIIGDPSAVGNRNSVLHDNPYPPRLSGTALAVYVARLFSVLCGAVTVFAVYQCGRVLAPEKPSVALLAAGLTAFTPQFLFIAASVNNDNLVTALNSLVIWQVLVLLRDGFSTRRSLAIALLVAFASLTKLSGLILIPVLALAGLWKVYRSHGRASQAWRGLIVLGGLMALCWALIAGWWYARNLALYGDLTGTQRMLDIFGRRPAPPLGELVLREADGLRMSFWGLFGWFNVLTFQPFYWAMDILTALGLVGLAVSAWKMRRDQLVKASFLALIIVIGLGSLITWTSQTAATQGRLLFPFIAAITCLLALGLTRLRIPALGIVLPLGLVALAIPFVTIIPAYAPPAPLTELPPGALPVYAQWEDMALVGYEMQPRRFAPGDAVPITLYWKPLQPADADYSLFVRLLDPDGNIVARLPTFPGYGRLRTSTWQPGWIYRDDYSVPIPRDAAGQFALRAYVGWWKFPEGTPLDPVDEHGQSIAQVIFPAGGLVGLPISPPEAEHVVEPVDFGGLISLVGYTLDGSNLTLYWQATGTPDDDLTVFAQVLHDGVVIEQGDAPPILPTRYWQPGERYQTHHHLVGSAPVAPGEYPLYVGWYSTTRPLRLAVDAPDNAYPLTTITIAS